jgi:hypothetical protein
MPPRSSSAAVSNDESFATLEAERPRFVTTKTNSRSRPTKYSTRAVPSSRRRSRTSLAEAVRKRYLRSK